MGKRYALVNANTGRRGGKEGPIESFSDLLTLISRSFIYPPMCLHAICGLDHAPSGFLNTLLASNGQR